VSSRRDYVDVAAAIRKAWDSAPVYYTQPELPRAGIALAAVEISALFAENSRQFDRELFLRNCGITK